VLLSQIRQQLETLLAEKARLAHENTVYARENWFLREIVEYHQLNMQDVVNLDDDDIEEEDDYDVDADDDEDAELEAEQHHDRRKSLPSQIVMEEEEHQAADPGTEPQSPSRHTESPRMLSTNSGGGGGFWVITPSNEFKNGGPLKRELTSHTSPTSLSVSMLMLHASVVVVYSVLLVVTTIQCNKQMSAGRCF